jgi:uncharacterized protein DUF6982
MNKVVAHYQDGHVLKGVTNDFLPAKDRFHLVPADSPPGSKPAEVLVGELKALFFVKDFAGDPAHKRSQEFEAGKQPSGRKIRVDFKDGEVMVGTTQGYQPNRPGFFVVPADAQSNNERCFVVTAATSGVSFV